MIHREFAITVAAIVVSLGAVCHAKEAVAPAARFTDKGLLEFPAGYRDWPFLASGLDMNYGADAGGPGQHIFDNVFVDPQALAAYRESGSWPDGTVLLKENRMGVTKGSINQSGHYQDEPVQSLELHIKDSRRFESGWAFYFFGSEAPASAIPTSAACYSCHSAHGAVDTTFVQFYPTLIGIARRHHTFKEDEPVKSPARSGAAPVRP